ncbi:hypothetical protein CapIbe_021963 [Capra ibex]
MKVVLRYLQAPLCFMTTFLGAILDVLLSMVLKPHWAKGLLEEQDRRCQTETRGSEPHTRVMSFDAQTPGPGWQVLPRNRARGTRPLPAWANKQEAPASGPLAPTGPAVSSGCPGLSPVGLTSSSPASDHLHW